MTNIEVELEHGFENYRLPEPGSPEEIAEAIRHSWDFLLVAPQRVTAPLLAAAYAAPLSEIVVPDFTIWLHGGTGSFKSTISALLLCHFGSFTETTLPLSFESTSNALERMLFLAKDIATAVDDWRPGVTRFDSDEMDRKAQRLLRAVGNRQGRGRMTSDTALRPSYPPRGVVIATAEALPEGPAFQSAASRAISVNLSREDINLDKLSELQRKKDMFSMAMAGYIEWIATRYDELAIELPERHEYLRKNKILPLLEGSHPRTPNNTATLILSLQQLRDFSISIGAMDKAEAHEKYISASNGVGKAAKAHTKATSGGDPASRFLDILRSLFGLGRIYVKDRETEKAPPNCKQLGWEGRSVGNSEEDWQQWPWEQQGIDDSEKEIYIPYDRADFIGWADEEYLYLDKEAAYATVVGFAQRGGIPFGIKPNSLWDSLAKAGVSLADKGRSNTTAKIKGETKRVVQIRRSPLFEENPS